MIRLIQVFILTLLVFLAGVSLFTQQYFAFFVQIFPLLFSLAELKYPNNICVRFLNSPLSPYLYKGIKASEYSKQMALFSAIWALIISILFTLALTFKLDVDSNPMYLVIFAFALPIFFGMSLLAMLFHTFKYIYIKLSKKDKVWG